MTSAPQSSWLLLVLLTLGACDDASSGESASPATAPEAAQKSKKKSLGRDDFELCPALEPHREELAKLAGFTEDPERKIRGFGKSCVIRGTSAEQIQIEVAPAFNRSIEMVADGYDGKKSPAEGLGPDALFVDVALQPHVVFAMGPLFLNIGIDNSRGTSRETTLKVAVRIRELLSTANPDFAKAS